MPLIFLARLLLGRLMLLAVAAVLWLHTETSRKVLFGGIILYALIEIFEFFRRKGSKIFVPTRFNILNIPINWLWNGFR